MAFYTILLAGVAVVAQVANPAGTWELSVEEVESFSIGISVSQIEYAPDTGLLFLREGETALHIYDTATQSEIATHLPTEKFTDMDLTDDSRYLFVADYGGERTGYGDPIRPHYVHRYDLQSKIWTIAEAPKIAWKIEAVSNTRVLLQEHDQWVDMTLNSFGFSMTELSRIRADYYGDFEYDPVTRRVYHGSSGSSSREVNVRRVDGDALVNVGNTGTYGTAQSGGGTSVLSTNGVFFYYGQLQVEAMSISNNLNYFAEHIYAASNDIAFGESEYYDARTGVILGDLGFESTVYGVSETGSHLWAFDAQAGTLHHYTIGVSTAHRLFALEIRGPAGIGFYDSAPYEALALYDDGTSAVVTTACAWSIDRSLFGSVDANGVLTTLNRPGGIAVSATYSEGNQSANGHRDVEVIHGYGESGVVEIESFSLNVNVEQIEYSPAHGLLCLRQSESRIIITDVSERQIIDTHDATEKFTDMDLTGDGRYLFVADYGGERTGYGDPIRPHYVHRYDLQSRTWMIAEAPKIAWKIEAVSDTRVLLQEHDQWVDLTLNSFGSAMTELSRIRADYFGDIEYDPITHRVYHGGSGSSSREIHVRRVEGDTLVDLGNTGIYGTAQMGGGTSVLSTDGAYFYYGRLQVEAMNVRNNLNYFPDRIHAASARIAFSEERYYSAESGEELSGLGFNTRVYGVSENGRHLWAFEPDGDILHHYRIEAPGANTPPVACIVDGNRAVQADGPSGAVVTLDASCSSDEDSTPGTQDDIDQFNWYRQEDPDRPDSLTLLGNGLQLETTLAIGEHLIVLEVVDMAGEVDEEQASIIVEDVVPPTFDLAVTPTELWPANHKMIRVQATWSVSDDTDASPVVSLVSITADEGDNVLGDGRSHNDVRVDGDGAIWLRAERSGTGDGRIYTLTYQAVDVSANTTMRSVQVIVGHDRRAPGSVQSRKLEPLALEPLFRGGARRVSP